MSWRRLVGASAVAAGVAVGSVVDTTGVAAPPVIGGYHVLAADLHVHAFPGDGALPPSELAREASRRGLHAIVVSNHNQTLAASLIGDRVGLPLMIPAQEITTPRFHLVAAGIRETVDWRLPEADIVRAVHAQGGVVIAAHPVDDSWRGSDALLAAIDGIEVTHPLTDSHDTGRTELDARFARARVLNPDIAPIGSSDFHMVAPIGARRTYVFAGSVTVAGVLDALRAGRTLAEDADGTLHGDARLIALMGNERPSRGERPTPLAVLSAVLALLGLLGLVVLG